MEADKNQAENKLLGGASFLEDEARESYTDEDYANPGTFTYTVTLGQEDEVVWTYGWCAAPDQLDQNLGNIDLTFTLEGEDVPQDAFHTFSFDPQADLSCTFYYTILSDWATGEHHLQTLATFTSSINDGSTDYPAGDWLYDYTVYVKP